jgi:hypothetical protein
MWESRLSGSERGRVATRTTGDIMWHRRKTRRQTENTNFALPSGECQVYSKLGQTIKIRDIRIQQTSEGATGCKPSRKSYTRSPITFFVRSAKPQHSNQVLRTWVSTPH